MSITILNVPVGATPATAVPLVVATDIRTASAIVIQARGGNAGGTGKNTGKIYIGNSAVIGGDQTSGIQLAIPIDGVTPPSVKLESGDNLNLFPLNQIYIAGEVFGDGVVALCHIVD
jgi:hypothetical protein